MKNKLVFFTVLLLLALVAAACGAQETTNVPGAVTTVSTVTTGSSTATEGAGEATMAPTDDSEASTPAQGAGEATMAPTIAAEGGTPDQGTSGSAVIPNTGPGDAGLPDDLDELVRVVRETGSTVDFGDEVTQDFLSVPGQIIMINGEEVQVFTYASAEEVEAQASQLENADPEDEPKFYKLGSMLVFYAGNDPGVRDLLEDVLGAQAAGQ